MPFSNIWKYIYIVDAFVSLNCKCTWDVAVLHVATDQWIKNTWTYSYKYTYTAKIYASLEAWGMAGGIFDFVTITFWKNHLYFCSPMQSRQQKASFLLPLLHTNQKFRKWYFISLTATCLQWWSMRHMGNVFIFVAYCQSCFMLSWCGELEVSIKLKIISQSFHFTTLIYDCCKVLSYRHCSVSDI